MEPVDPGKNVEGTGCSKRRISSILKAPRKSLLLRDSEQQENEVEPAKPVEKRNLRRVSFAPANDVLLFAKDAKNASPARNPLQELMGPATATTQNRVQVMTAEDTSPQIMGIDTLLNAPLHASQQRTMVHFDSGSGIGENTVVFSTEDADMDMTHSHTININSDADLLGDPDHQNYDLLLSGGGDEADVFTEVPPSHFAQATNQASALLLDRKTDSSVETRAVSTAAPLLDPGFKDFLSSLSKLSPSNTGMTLLTSDDIKSSLAADVDKENQMPKSLSSSRNTGESFNGSGFRPDDDVTMDVTEAQTGCTLDDNDDDPFQCLFPTQEMYEKSERQSQARGTNQQQSCESLESNDQTAKKSLINLSVLTPLESHEVCSGLKNDFREKTVVFAADDFMDITQNLTGSIAGADRSLLQHKIPTNDVGRENYPNRSGVDPAAPVKPGGDFSTNMTEAQTALGSDDVFQFLLPSEEMQPLCQSQKKEIFALGQQHNDGAQSSDHKGLKTSKLNMEPQRHQLMDKIAAPDDYREKTLPFSADDCLDVTQSRTVHISTNIKPNPLQNDNMAPSCEEKSIRFYADDVTMDMTQCLTTNIATDLASDKFTSLLSLSTPNDCAADSTMMADGFTVYLEDNMDMTEAQTGRILEAEVSEEMLHKHESLQAVVPTEATHRQSVHGKTERNLHQQHKEGFGASDYTETSTKTSLKTIMQRNQVEFESKDDGREKTVRFDAADVCMDVTRCNTMDISSDLPFQNQDLAADGEKTVRFGANDAEMDVTKSHTVNILSDLPLQSLTNVALPANGEKTVRFNANDAAMDITRSHTVDIAHDLNVLVHKKEDFLPAEGERTQRFGASDAEMDVTKCYTVNIMRDLPLQSFPNVAIPSNGEKTLRFSAKDAEMDVTKSHTVNILRDFPNVAVPSNGEKTEHFISNEAAMDVTRSHTVKIFTDAKMALNQNENLLPAGGDKTVRFNANDAAMDITKSHTVNIVHDVDLLPHQNVDALPADGERTVRFGVNDAEMDVTKSHTVNIRRDLTLQSFPNLTMPSNGEKTVRFSANEAAMDVTRSHTVNIVQDLDLLPHQNVDALPADGERTVRFGVNDVDMESTKSLTGKVLVNSNVLSDQIANPLSAKEENLAWLAANDVTMDITRSHTVSIVTDFDQITESSPTDKERISNTFVDETGSDTKSISKNYKLASRYNAELLPKSGEKTTKFTTNNATLNMTHCPRVNIVNNPLFHPVMSDQNSENMNDTLTIKEMDKMDSGNCGLDSNPSPSTQSDLFQTSCAQVEANRNTPSCPDSSHSLRKTQELDTGPENESSSLGSNVDKPINKTKTDTEEICASVNQTDPLASSTDDPPQGVSSKQNPHSKSFKESVSDEPRPGAETQAVSQKMESSPSNADQNAVVPSSRMSRRKSLADLQSKVKRLSQLINAAPDPPAVETCTVSLLHPDPSLETNTNDVEAEPLSVATSSTPFSLKTKQLMSRLSVGGFKPKLPKRNTADDLNKSAIKEPTKTFTVSVPNQLSQFDKFTDIHDEELVDCEDFSETIDTMTPEKFSKKDNSSDQFSTFQPLEEVFAYMDDFMSSSQRQKRSLLENEDETEEDEKRKKMCTEFAEPASQSDVDDESNMAAARTQTIGSPSNIISRCEIASESTFKHSLFESQLEDYSSDGQKKLEDGTITVLEFFNLFSIDFVIHNPRQSVLPARLLENSDATALDLLKDKHISRPKQTVYEADVKSLTEKVEGLKYRMQDLGKPLKTVNRSLWEEVNQFTEKELKSFGAKLKERNNFFRKNSKVQSHEMKAELYANLVRVNLEEQQKLRGTISQADEMIQTLDGCISELEAELDAVVEKGSENKPSLKSLQEEMSKVTETLADHERQTSELDLEKKKNSCELTKLKAEERKLENYIDALNMLNEWRLEEKDNKKDNCSVFTFLHKTLFLRLVYEKTKGNDADSKSERKMTNISFKFNLSDEKSQCHARLVHKLVSQFIEGESDWVEKYPSSGHVPKLLQDVSLVVSRCRLVGEELRLLKMWGNLRFDILHISCSHTQIHVVFSSLRKLSKFEVVFGVRLTDQICVFHVQSFKNLIGNTTIQQIEEVVASLSPGRDLFTRIIKKIHETLLS
ncbi:protein CASC5 isoform X1 [Poecilia latipinna]|uniref:Kinetochore scaffold 1 n=1 Tax=Poecilia latipinna TaxID=48699 RepID=A0A3B3UDV2_9TELE|nr:PREDICTED: protein CASC5 isoform X1 [Poecilia latipinna]